MTDFSWLYKRDKRGTLRKWRVWTDGEHICTEYGAEGGLLQTSRRKAEPTNVGRANARNGEQQAQFEAEAMFTKHTSEGWALSPEDAGQDTRFPAKVVDWVPAKAQYPGFVQPKLNGIRATLQVSRMTPGTCILLSRRGKPFKLQHILQAGASLPPGTILDGELFGEGLSFQEICSLVKKPRPESKKIALWIFDIPVWGSAFGLPFETRYHQLLQLRRDMKDCSAFGWVRTQRVFDEAEVLMAYRKALAKGHEGLIFRNAKGVYTWGYPTYDIMRLKPTFDAEFEIVGFDEGRGRDRGCVVWICKTTDGTQFRVRPRGTVGERRAWFQQAPTLVGRKLKVEFKGYSDRGVPRHPVGVGIRLREDE